MNILPITGRQRLTIFRKMSNRYNTKQALKAGLLNQWSSAVLHTSSRGFWMLFLQHVVSAMGCFQKMHFLAL